MALSTCIWVNTFSVKAKALTLVIRSELFLMQKYAQSSGSRVIAMHRIDEIKAKILGLFFFYSETVVSVVNSILDK